MYRVRVTFLLRSYGVSVTYRYSYGISLSFARPIKAYMCYVRVTYVWRIYGACTTFHSYLRRICSVPIAFGYL